MITKIGLPVAFTGTRTTISRTTDKEDYNALKNFIKEFGLKPRTFGHVINQGDHPGRVYRINGSNLSLELSSYCDDISPAKVIIKRGSGIIDSFDIKQTTLTLAKQLKSLIVETAPQKIHDFHKGNLAQNLDRILNLESLVKLAKK